MKRLVLRAVLRATALITLTAVGLAAAYWDARDSSGGANLGLGLLVVLGQALVASVWAAGDACRRPVGGTLAVWATASVFGSVGGLLMSRLLEAQDSGWSWTVLFSDLLLVAPTMAALTFASAGLGALVGATLRGPQSARSGPSS